MPDLNVALRLRADAKGLVGEVRLSKRELERLGREAQRTGGRARTAQRLWRGFGREMEQTRRRATGLRLAMTALATGVGLRVGASFLKAASDAEELRSQFEAVFRTLTGEARQWADAHAELVGRSSLDIQQYLATLQDTFVPLGFARREAFELSRTLTRLGVDLASFKNAAEPETIDLLTSAIVGNHEAVRRFGIVITEATLDQELLNAGFKGGVRSATDLQKVMARVRIILRSTADAQGDAARTADQHANQVRALAGDWRDFQTVLGRGFIPTANTAIALLRQALGDFEDEIDPDALADRIENAFRAILLGTADVVDTLAGPLDAAQAVISEIIAGFNRLPPWVQEIGILGAILLGTRGRAILVGLASVGAITDLFDVDDAERFANLQRLILENEEGLAKARERAASGNQAAAATVATYERALKDLRATLELGRRRAAAAPEQRADVIPALDFTGGSLVGRGGRDPGAARRFIEQALGRRDAAPRRPRAQPDPFDIPNIPTTAGDALTSAQEKEIARFAERMKRAAEAGAKRIAEQHRRGIREIEDAELDLSTPYEAAIAEAERWRTQTLALLDANAADYEATAERIDAVYFQTLAKAAVDSFEAQEKAAREALTGIEKGFADYADEALDVNTQIERATKNALRGMEDAFVQFVQTGKLSFSDLAKSIIADLARIAARQAIGGLVGSLLGSFGASGGGFSPGFGSFPTSHTGGVAGRATRFRSGVDPRVFAFAQRLHRGGIAGDEVPTILRRGETVRTPEQEAALGRTMGGPRVLRAEIRNEGTPQRIEDASATIDAEGWVISIVTRDIATGGDTARAIETIVPGTVL